MNNFIIQIYEFKKIQTRHNFFENIMNFFNDLFNQKNSWIKFSKWLYQFWTNQCFTKLQKIKKFIFENNSISKQLSF